ncbi:hypothetical protein DFJ74DRAFT_674169 [Hyaloraphidium curvatum]|nr:hypothetical protein DFJ74DRAFT_674169 [Hyaloraphidium curvatum]
MTVIHTVFLRVKPDSTPEAVAAFQAGLKGMVGKVPGITRLEVGPTFTTSQAAGFTHMIVIEFASKEDLEAFRPHPDHVHVRDNLIGPVAAEKVVLDIEV